MISWRFLTIRKALGAFHFTTAKATGADVHTHRRSVDVHTHSLRVRSPRTASFMVGMAHGVTGNDALMADLTKLSHTLSHLLQGYVTTNSRIIPPSGEKRK